MNGKLWIRMTERLWKTFVTRKFLLICRRFGEDPECPGMFKVGDRILSKPLGKHNDPRVYYHEACWRRLLL